MASLRLLLLLTIITIVNAASYSHSPLLWPRPTLETPSDQVLQIDPANFLLVSTGYNSDVLASGFERYNDIIFVPSIIVDANVNSARFDSKRQSYKAKDDPLVQQQIRRNAAMKGITLSEEWYAQEFKQGAVGLIYNLSVNVLTNDMTLALETDETYNLTVTAPVATLQANTAYGALRGLETFSQLVYYQFGVYLINQTVISDSPRFQYRGHLFDPARHFEPMSVIFAHIDSMAYTKMNVFHWHIVDNQAFPYRSIVYPELSIKGAYNPETHVYSQEDVANVIEYARLRGIRVVVEFDTPGHTDSWGLGYPELLADCYDSEGNFAGVGPMDPTTDYIFPFLTNFFNEVASVFPDQYVHLGGDEVDFSCWQSNPQIQKWMQQRNWTDYALLENYYEQTLLTIVNATGKSYIVWQEIFDNGLTIRPDTVVEVWKEPWQSDVFNVTQANFRAIISSPWYLNYISYGQDWPTYYSVEPLDFNGTAAQQQLVMGGEACMWAEYVDSTNSLSRTWPRMCSVAERLWSPASVTDIQDAEIRIDIHTCRLIARGIPAEPPNGAGYCATQFPFDYEPPFNLG